MDDLLELLASGDEDAIEQVYERCKPLLQMIVRRQLSADFRARFDSEDICQSVWADLLQGFRARQWEFTTSAQLRAFLVRAAKNRLVDRIRKATPGGMGQRNLDWAQELANPSPSPIQEAEANERWMGMIDACPPQHRAVVELKRKGYKLAEIAEQTGLHPSSVRRILYELAYRIGVASRASEHA